MFQDFLLSPGEGMNIASGKVLPGFNPAQSAEINIGRMEGIDTSLYENPNYDFLQMREIRLGLKAGVDTTQYLRSEYPWYKMHELRCQQEDWQH